MNQIINQFNKCFQLFDKDVIKITKNCLKFSFYFCIFATLFLITYKFYSIPSLFFIGATLLKYGIIYSICTIVFSLAFSKIKNDF